MRYINSRFTYLLIYLLTFATFSSVSRPRSAAVKHIDIADILGSEISVNIDIDKGAIDPALH